MFKAEDDAFLRRQREVMLRRLTRDDIPAGVLPKVMETFMEIERNIALHMERGDD